MKEEPLLYPNQTLLLWKNNGLPAYVKIGGTGYEWWVSLQWDTDKPLLKKDGSPNRWAVRQTDEGMNLHYGTIMDFKLP